MLECVDSVDSNLNEKVSRMTRTLTQAQEGRGSNYQTQVYCVEQKLQAYAVGVKAYISSVCVCRESSEVDVYMPGRQAELPANI